jgi:hypothetical protein
VAETEVNHATVLKNLALILQEVTKYFAAGVLTRVFHSPVLGAVLALGIRDQGLGIRD